jgi:ubiquitin-activating enzyme E1
MKDEEMNNFYNRSLLNFGVDTMNKLSSMKILIIGMRGLGIETAKNIILSGVKQVDIFDSNIVKITDLGSNFFLSELDVNKKNETKHVYKNFQN